MVYTSGSIALCTLELLVQLRESSILDEYVLFRAEIDDSAVEVVAAEQLPANWRDYPAPQELAAIGENWTLRRSSLALKVPSAIVPFEVNYLLNPVHPDFRSLRIEGPIPYEFDHRLV